MFSFWSSTLQNIYIHVHTSERKRKETPTNPLCKLSSLSAFFCFQWLFWSFLWNTSSRGRRTLHCPRQLGLEGLGEIPHLHGKVQAWCKWEQVVTDVTPWKYSEEKASEEQSHFKMNSGSFHRCWTDLTEEHSGRKSLKQDFSFT